jgi:Protein of unknown function (DUF4232)
VRYAFALSVVMLLMCFSTSAFGSSGQNATAARTEVLRASPCKAAQLSAAEDPSDAGNGGAGNEETTIAITNRSPSACVVEGVPKVTLSYYPSNRPVALRICPNCDSSSFWFLKQPVKGILVQPGGSAYIMLGYSTRPDDGPCTTADSPTTYTPVTIHVYLPGQAQPISMKDEYWHSCGRVAVTPFLRTPGPA